MNVDFPLTLWSDPERSRYFLIPDDRPLPNGTFELRTVTGKQQHVDEVVLPEFEISRDEAKVWLKEQFGQVLTSTKTGIMDALKNWRSPPASPTSDPTGATPDEEPAIPSARISTALSELEDLLGQSTEQVREKSAISLKHLGAIATALNGMFEGAISSDPDGLERAQAQTQILRENLKALGIRSEKQLENFPERLHALYFAEGQAENFADNADQLEAIATQIEQTSALAVKSIRAMAQQQRKQSQR